MLTDAVVTMLFTHTSSARRSDSLNRIRLRLTLLEELADLNQQQQQLKQTISEKRKKLDKLREERLKNEPKLFD